MPGGQDPWDSLPVEDHGALRRHDEARPGDYRGYYARDCDRILYASAFRRLNGVTQVVSADETQLFHNRLTHTLKVAQIARRIAERLSQEHTERLRDGSGLSPAATEAAALAHDLGHPPFGHIAEERLMALCDARGIDGYEGNAQTFRIVTKLSWRESDPGLNLSRRTLRAIMKYPWLRAPEGGDAKRRKKWGAYKPDTSDFDFAMELGAAESRSLEAEIMDWADDITYAVHDLEDFFRAGLTPIARMQQDDAERQWFVIRASTALAEEEEFDRDEAARSFSEILETVSLPRPYAGTVRDRRQLHVTSSFLITRFIENTMLGAGDHLHIPHRTWHEVNMLKQLTWHYVINSPDLATIQEGQRQVISMLFEALEKWATEETNRDRLPTRLREQLRMARDDQELMEAYEGDEAKIRARAIADYIASLTESQAVELHQRLLGLSQTSILHGWVRTQ